MNQKEDILMGVLYAIRYVHSAMGSLCDESFPSSRIISFKMFLTSLLLTSTDQLIRVKIRLLNAQVYVSNKFILKSSKFNF